MAATTFPFANWEIYFVISAMAFLIMVKLLHKKLLLFLVFSVVKPKSWQYVTAKENREYLGRVKLKDEEFKKLFGA